MDRFALTGAAVFDGETTADGMAVIVRDGLVEAVCQVADIPDGMSRVELDAGLLVPGFIDIQVNGGGGVLLNETPSVEGVHAICEAHRCFGSTALLPTVITDRPEVTFAAIDAVAAAMAAGVPGCIGIHVEGPFISTARKGAHDPSLIRKMTDSDVDRLAATSVRPLLLTVAPESVSNEQIARLSGAGVLVSLGHSDAEFERATSAFDAGARCGTHLFNAMSQLSHRKPGLVGAVLERDDVWCGIIADGHHVHPAAIGVALRAKRGVGRVLAITDAMPTVGVADDVFWLNGRRATRRDGKLTLDDGTLAGSDLTMIGAVRYLTDVVGVPFEESLRMAATYPAQFLQDHARGRIEAGRRADLVWLNCSGEVGATWIGGGVHRVSAS
ncbi:N-acetylglucosamine-6-phosphate deacetylase [Aureimonas phyllosphaerae]|uniref:N-acetylglucosamine-6-phosphate deacetylase n=1 Tax=Aureimonas phyllosphaerae TaxID=1166078 RepID=A0A7W6FVB0_9HYPH|nr:N-acetylglucosamine-6-phosphate deacetylase [Aureimonas phyllosphaerae]MBB3960791.1 N-acetylglucosamine-6-phosphate deacetylase [Aureimonas phyllosphaerae]SFF50151.1 N-acetylglucosamine-6-phosphate deacetylase [Aureimonas phyllosphaerae]